MHIVSFTKSYPAHAVNTPSRIDDSVRLGAEAEEHGGRGEQSYLADDESSRS